MTELVPKIGRVCRSKAGRDKGRTFLIWEVIDEEYVRIVDGQVRKIAKPKKKKRKHLELKYQMLEGIASKIEAGTKVFDAEIRSALMALEDQEQAAEDVAAQASKAE